MYIVGWDSFRKASFKACWSFTPPRDWLQLKPVSEQSSLLVQSNYTRIFILSYLRPLEEFGLENYEDISNGVIEAILLRGGGQPLLGKYKLDQHLGICHGIVDVGFSISLAFQEEEVVVSVCDSWGFSAVFETITYFENRINARSSVSSSYIFDIVLEKKWRVS